MSRSKKVVNFTFWMNNIWQIGFIFIAIATVNNWHLSAFIALGIIIVALTVELVYLQKKFHVFQSNIFDSLYFIEDERDKIIALKVHNQLMVTYSILSMIFFLLLMWLWGSHNGLSLSAIFYYLIAWLALILIIPNVQYFILWNKYDEAD